MTDEFSIKIFQKTTEKYKEICFGGDVEIYPGVNILVTLIPKDSLIPISSESFFISDSEIKENSIDIVHFRTCEYVNELIDDYLLITRRRKTNDK